jgi:hypothetical protein
MMDCDTLISLVQERSLWDVQDKQYHDRDVARKLWAEIAIVYGMYKINSTTT